MIPGKVYLGDSVYCEWKNGMFTLTTENGAGPSNTIHLEPEVFARLVEFVEAIRESEIRQKLRQSEGLE